jgi:uncharacterized protein (TIGR03067 family)
MSRHVRAVLAVGFFLAGGAFLAADDAKEEMAKIQGTWQLVSAETDGKKLPEDQVRQTRVVIKGGKHTVYFGDKAVVKGVSFRIDPTKRPKEVTDTLEDGREVRGIYELDGDTLRSCVAGVDKERPKRLTGEAGSGQTLRVFRRVAEGAEDPARREYARFEGTWKFVSIEANGKKLPAGHFKDSRLVLRDDRFTLREPGVAFGGSYRVDVSRKPKRIDVTFTEGPQKGKTMQGIYELEGDTYTVCMGMPGKGRPAEFASKPGSGHVFEVLEREKGAARDDAGKEELKRLAGTWQAVSYELDGKKASEEDMKKIRLLIDADGNAKAQSEGKTFIASRIKVDPAKRLKTMDITFTEGEVAPGKTAPGIYKLEGETLTICRAAPGKDRPTEFTGKAGTGLTLMVYQKAK